MRRCPFCSEEITPEARYCPFCGKVVSVAQQLKWYHRGYALFVGFLVIGPLILPAIWSHPHYSRTAKWVITLLMAALTIALAMATLSAVKNIKDYYKIYFDAIGNG